jgi:hypothetical protein
MFSGFVALAPLFVGPSVFLVGTLLVIGLLLVIARAVIGLAWKLVVIGTIILGMFWLLGAIGIGPFGLG